MTCVRVAAVAGGAAEDSLCPAMRVRLGLRRCLLTACRRSVLVSAGSARGAETALRIEQEHASRHDLFTFSQALANLDAIGQLGADRHGAAARTYRRPRRTRVAASPCRRRRRAAR